MCDGRKREVMESLSRMISTYAVVNVEGTIYMYLTEMLSWSVISSDEALRTLAMVTGGEKASVNYHVAASPYLPFLASRAHRVGVNKKLFIRLMTILSSWFSSVITIKLSL